MKKRFFALMVVLTLVLSMLAPTASARAVYNMPEISFSGTTATCYVNCRSGNSSDTVQATLTLRENGTLVAGWNDSGTGSVTLSKPYAATSGASYTLTLNYSINGVKQTPVSISATCP